MIAARAPARWLVLLALARAGCGVAADNAGELADLLAQPVYGSSRVAGAAKQDQDLSDSPGMVYVRTGGEIRAQGYRTLAEVLDSLPGTHSTYDRSYTYTGVRGVNRPGDYSSRLLLLIDGVRVNEAIYDSATGGGEFPLDLGLIDRVEYIPGPGSALYGSNAVLGVVNIITRSAAQLPGPALTLEAGSNHARKLALTWGGDWGPVRVLLGLTSERLDGNPRLYFAEYDSPGSNGGIAQGRDGEQRDRLFAKLRWRDFTLSAAFSDRLKLDPTASYGAIFDTRSESRDRYTLLNLTYDGRHGEAHELYGRIGLAGYTYDGLALYGSSDAPIPGASRGDARWLAGELRYAWSGWADHRLLLGTEFQNNYRQNLWSADLEPAPQLYTDLRLRSSRWSVFVNDEWQLGAGLRLNLGLRSDRRLDGRQTTTPRIAALWSPGKALAVKVQHGLAFREPNIFELRNADNTQRQSLAIEVESTRSTEASVLWRPAPGLDLSATAYTLKMRDLIDLVTQADGLTQYQNVGSLRSHGFELEATRAFGDGWQARASWSHQHGADAATGAALSDSPRVLIKLLLTAPGPWEGSRIGVNAQHVGARLTLAGARLPPYLQVNTQLNWAPPGRAWTLCAALYNLGDQRHTDPAGPNFRQDALVQDGRRWRLQLGWAH